MNAYYHPAAQQVMRLCHSPMRSTSYMEASARWPTYPGVQAADSTALTATAISASLTQGYTQTRPRSRPRLRGALPTAFRAAAFALGAHAGKNGGMADERESKELQSGTLVIGLGRFGSAVAVTQDQLGYEILAVEKNPARVQAFAGRFPLVEADATSKDALEQLGAREFRSAVVGVGSSLEAAVLITANLVDMGISSIWVKATSSQHGRILRRVGAHHVVYPDLDAGKRTAHLVGGRMVDYIEMEKDGFSIMKLRPPQEVRGFSLEELDLRGRYGVNVLAIRRPKQRFEYADSSTRINADDEIIVSGDSHLLEYFANRP